MKKNRIISILMSTVLFLGIEVVQTNEYSLRADDNMLTSPVVAEGVTTWDCVWFGRYPQSDATGQTYDPIKWRVLSVDSDGVLLMADKNLDLYKYNDKYSEVNWETSTLRDWLNSSFINRAFTEKEKNEISYTNTDIGNDNVATEDKVFVLSVTEAMNPAYGFGDTTGSDAARVRTNTAYVANKGSLGEGQPYGEGKADFWWLRDAGQSNVYAATVETSGKIDLAGDMVCLTNTTVCPVIRLRLGDKPSWCYAGTVNSKGDVNEKEPVTTEIETSTLTETESRTTIQRETSTTQKQTTTAQKPTTVVVPEKTKIKSAIKGKTSKKLKVSLRATKNVYRYEIAIYTSKKGKKALLKKKVKKAVFALSSKKIKGKNKLFIRVRVLKKVGKKIYKGKWTKLKKVKIKK